MPVSTVFVRSGEWLPTEELLRNAIVAAASTTDVTIDLADVEHLEASVLQILLALAHDRKRKNLRLELLNACPTLRQWFDWAGAVSYLSPHSPDADD